MAIKTVQELIIMLEAIKNRSLQPFIYCAKDGEFISIDKIAVEEEVTEEGKTRVVIWEGN